MKSYASLEKEKKMYFSVISFQEFLNFRIWVFSENVQCFIGVFLLRKEKTTKRSLELASLSHFLHNFEKFLLLDSITWPKFVLWLLLLREILGKECIVIAYEPSFGIIDFEINLTFLTKPFFLERKKLLKWSKKCFHYC